GRVTVPFQLLLAGNLIPAGHHLNVRYLNLYSEKIDATAFASSPTMYVRVVTVFFASSSPNRSVDPGSWMWATISSLSPNATGASCSRVMRVGPRSSSGVADRYSSTTLQYTELFMWSNRSMSVNRTPNSRIWSAVSREPGFK